VVRYTILWEERSMTGKPGDRVIAESERVGQPVREGEILEVVHGAISVRYRVRWADGHESVLTPSAGSLRIISPHERRTA
jgi:hypothetical protein